MDQTEINMETNEVSIPVYIKYEYNTFMHFNQKMIDKDMFNALNQSQFVEQDEDESLEMSFTSPPK